MFNLYEKRTKIDSYKNIGYLNKKKKENASLINDNAYQLRPRS